MNEFLRRLAQALGLEGDATEDQVIARVAQLAQGAPDVRELAQRTGQVVLPADQVATLTQQAQAGQDALEQVKTLRSQLNEQSFESLMASSSAAPSLRDTYRELWNQGHQDEVRKLVAAAPAPVRMSPVGRIIDAPGADGSGGSGHLTLVQGTPLDRLGAYNVNPDRLELHQKIEGLALAKGITYEAALAILSDSGEATG